MLAHAPTRADRRAVSDPDRGSLTDAQFFDVARLVRMLPGRWLVERRESSAGAVSALLVQDLRGGGGLAFALARRGGQLRLDLRRNGRSEPLGAFETVERAMGRVVAYVEHTASGDARGEETSRTGHLDAGSGPGAVARQGVH